MSEKEIGKRRNGGLQRHLKTPPKPQAEIIGKRKPKPRGQKSDKAR